jgi:hypothetical protein
MRRFLRKPLMGMRIPRAFLTASALLFAAAPAFATSPSEAFSKRVVELVGWISTQSDYPALLQQMPAFVFLSSRTIRHSFSGSAMGYTEQMSAVVAAQVSGTIYLPDTFQLGRDDYILVHELVHHLQDESGRTFECLASREREAYRIQTKFVQETGTGQMPNDMYMLMLRCDIR